MREIGAKFQRIFKNYDWKPKLTGRGKPVKIIEECNQSVFLLKFLRHNELLI